MRIASRGSILVGRFTGGYTGVVGTNELVVENLGLAHWAARRWGAGIEYDDAVSMCLLVLCEAALKHDPARGKFTTFVHARLRGVLLDEKRKRAGRHREVPTVLSLNHILKEDTEFDIPDPHAPAFYENSGIWVFIKYLTRREQDVLYLRYVKEMKYHQIARRLSLSESRIMQLNNAAIKKLRAKLTAQGAA